MADPIAVIDPDTHVTEPVDVWTSRLPRKCNDAPNLAICPTTSVASSISELLDVGTKRSAHVRRK